MATNPNFEDRIRTGALTVTITTGRIVNLFERAPHKVYFHIRDTLGAIFFRYREAWIKRTEVEFHRGGLKVAQFGSSAGSEGGTFATETKFFHIVSPKKKSVPRSETPRLEQIKGEAFTHSEAAQSLESGGTFRARGAQHLTIPIGHALRSDKRPKAAFRSLALVRKAGKETIARLKPGQAPVVYLVKRLKRKTKYKPIFLLVRSITKKPRLKFFDTWDFMKQDRERRFSKMLGKITDELERGKR